MTPFEWTQELCRDSRRDLRDLGGMPTIWLMPDWYVIWQRIECRPWGRVISVETT